MVTYSDLQDVKSELASAVPDKAYRGKPIAGAYNNVRKMISDEMRNKIYSKVPDTVKQAYLDYGNLKTIADRGASALTKPYVEGGSGKVLGQILKTGTTPIKTIGGKILNKVGKAIK